MFRNGKILRLARLAFAGSVLGCASGGGAGAPAAGPPSDFDDQFQGVGLNPDRGETVPKVRFFLTAEENWNEAERRFERKDYLAAQQYYAFIRAKFPYARYAALSDVRIADCQFAREHWLEAVDSYSNFVRLHPGHRLVPYAMFRTGLAQYEQIPGNFFLLPPAEEKDQTAVEEAEKALAAYLRRFPQDENVEEAQEVYAEVRERLMKHERYAADFYRRLGKDRAYLGRLEVIRERFPDVGLDAGLLLEIARVSARLGEVDRVQSTFDAMAERFPQSDALKARRALVAEAEAAARAEARREEEQKPGREAERAG